MLRILVITTVKVGYDGLTNHIFSYISNMDKKDMQIDFVSARGIDEKIMPQLKSVGFHEIYRLEFRDTHHYRYFKDLLKLIKTNKYDIIHAHGNSATLAIDLAAARLAGCKVRIAHSHTTSCKHKVFNICLKPLFYMCCTDGFACGCEAGQWLFGNKPFKVLPNGKEIDKYRFNPTVREEYRRKLSLHDRKVAIGNVAAFEHKKNHKFLISLFQDLIQKDDRYEMYLFGIEGETLKDVNERIRASGLENKIHYMGTKDNIQDYMQAMDIMLLPSLYEGFPVSVIEWQINGLSCILSDTITRDCNFLGNIRFLPINKGTEPWVDEIMAMNCQLENRIIPNIEDIFTKSGYNIRSNAADLKKMYFELAAKRKG